jgi:leucyl aminopeptidase (aminopeptidase T)
MKYIELGTVAKTILKTCTNVMHGEEVLIITDPGYSKEFIESLLIIADAEGIRVTLVTLTPSDVKSPPNSVTEALKLTDVGILCTSTNWRFSSQATKAALTAKTRIFSLSRFTDKDLISTVPIDYEKLQQEIDGILDRLKNAYEVHITTKAGTNVKLEGEGRTLMYEDGIVKPGEWDTIPGVIFTSPIENRTEGVIVIDGSIGYFPLETGDVTQLGVVRDLVTLWIKEGKIVNLEGGKAGKDLERIIARGGDNADVIGEWGIGLNPGARLSGNFLADEPIYGAAHFGIGANTQMGGKNQCQQHIDAICMEVTLQINGEIVMEEGKLII